jgi:hypothetical protein
MWAPEITDSWSPLAGYLNLSGYTAPGFVSGGSTKTRHAGRRAEAKGPRVIADDNPLVHFNERSASMIMHHYLASRTHSSAALKYPTWPWSDVSVSAEPKNSIWLSLPG